MKITLIKPMIGRKEYGPYIDEGRMEPLQLGVLAGMIPEDIDVAFYDDRMEEVPFDEPTDLVAITVEAFTARRAYEISKEYRQRGVPVIMGGMHATLIPEEVKQHADSVCLWDAESQWLKAIGDARRGQLQPFYRDDGIGIPQKGIPTRRDIFRGKGYLPVSLLQFSRGCRFKCNFCATGSYFKQRHYCREFDEVFREIDAQDRKILFFVDDNFIGNVKKVKAFLKELIPMKIYWVSQMSIDVAQDPELLDLMQKSGCIGFVVGFESIYAESLQWMNKIPNLKSFKQYESEIKKLHDHGFQLWAAFTLGHDYDTVRSIEDTIDFAIKNKFTFAAFNILMPYPNTPLYKQLEEEGRLLYDKAWWLHPDYRFNYAAFKPKHMSADKLTEMGYHARTKFNSFGSIFKRVFNLKTNMRSLFRLWLYVRYSAVFRKEVHNKQGLRLGIFGRKFKPEQGGK